jgi:hypothetical protein
VVLNWKGSVAYREWLRRGADALGIEAVSVLAERAVEDYLRRRGFAEPPPDRQRQPEPPA